MNNTRHVAASGASQGQWVKCPAKKGCTLNSIHVNENDFQASKLWLKDEKKVNKNLTDITAAEVEEFLQSPDRVKYQEKYLKKTTKPEPRKSFNPNDRYEFTDEMRESLHQEAEKIRAQQASQPKTMKYEKVNLNSVDRYDLKKKCDELKIEMTYDSEETVYRGAVTGFQYTGLRFEGPTHRVDEAIAFMEQKRKNTVEFMNMADYRSSTVVWNQLQEKAENLNIRIEHGPGKIFTFRRTIQFPNIDFFGKSEDLVTLANWFRNQS